jgi:23S rRNA (guanosine2251-2'-O)-methyltransferase
LQIEDACAPAQAGRPVLVLDQITDPQNIGALFRSAAAFGARAVIVQDRRTPPLSCALAKAAAGAIEKIPCVEVVNIARAIEALQELGYFCAGLAGDANTEIGSLPVAPLALVMGAEGDGLRRLVAEKCDQLFRIPIQSDMESLNVSTAAAISLYEAQRSR